MRQRTWMALAGGAALAAAAACSRSAPSAADDGLRADLEAARQAASQGSPARTQFVSPLELGRAAEPRRGAVAAPRPAGGAPAHTAVRRPRAAAERVVRPAARVRAPEPAPAAEVVAERVEAPRPADEPAPREEPVVAAPSRRPAPAPAPGRGRGRVWGMGDVIRNAPFPINP